MSSSPPSSLPGISGFYPLDASADRADRRRYALTRLGLLSYGVDAALMLAFSAIGVLPGWAGVAYGLGGAVVTMLFYWVQLGGRTLGVVAPYWVALQLLCHASVVWLAMYGLPQIGMLLLMVLFIVLGFGSLQMNAKHSVRVPLTMALLIGGLPLLMVLWANDGLGVPMASPAQRFLSGLWLALLLARSTALGLFGAQLRAKLAQRNGEFEQALEQLNRLAHRDELTGALNRRSVMRLLDNEWERMHRSGRPFALALLDLDHFKAVNDQLGHLIGDEVLRRFALRAAAGMRATDRLGRFGGEEFLMVMPATEHADAAYAAVERVRDGVQHSSWEEVQPGLRLTVSCGVAVAHLDETVEQLLQRADEALYRAKHEGRNCTRLG